MGHPQIITENFADISTYFGLIKCTILPPRGLLHPVLPYRTPENLMFPLCKTCADTKNKNPCTHTDQERAIRGTWCHVEVMKAIEKGYESSNVLTEIAAQVLTGQRSAVSQQRILHVIQNIVDSEG